MCRTAKVDTVRSLGADHVIDYTREDIRAAGRRYDVILDTGQTLTTLICSENTPDLLALTKLTESGQVRPVIDRTNPLSQTPAAIQYMRDGHAQGKVVMSL
jgi:NADPH:quinone reductase-like Zn-dependent oxidoreductase